MITFTKVPLSPEIVTKLANEFADSFGLTGNQKPDFDALVTIHTWRRFVFKKTMHCCYDEADPVLPFNERWFLLVPESKAVQTKLTWG